MSGNVCMVNGEAEFEKYLNSNELVAMYFTATWCGPCKFIKPFIEQFGESYKNIQICKVDLDTNSQLASKYMITSVPNFLFFYKKNKVNQITGANPQELNSYFATFSQLSPNAVRSGDINSRARGSSKNAVIREADKLGLIPKGFEVLNDSIDFSNFEALNVLALVKNKSKVRNLLKLVDDNKEVKYSSVISDADSQINMFIPFQNISKIHSVLVRFKPISKTIEESNEGDELEDLEYDELQKPKKLKIWNNLPNMLSFEDADSLTNFQHLEELDEDKWIKVSGDDEETEEWYVAKLKYVKFQNCKSLNVFIDGEDEDNHTLLDKILIVGVNGETRQQGTISKISEEE
ncbi:thioredoxin-like protein 1 [Ascoidea rubescens DSM 1968]|uniref:Thioredoxin-like protein n=1 Tax=Ascoidea rubescens DSM 1968 TaxID=1344418 RepID=A0A1D2VSJ1_9ASCO|nr:thioredoxin-like protein [Ascoidea rubescens DSM 1968]ODV64548.1 thioredoxin-like protein [Ascoidea rubescens DSM 1968]